MAKKTKKKAKKKAVFKLTPKQDKAAMKYVECGNKSEAYRHAYDTDNMKPETINRKAKELFDNGKVTARVKELQDIAATRHDVTLDSLTEQMIEDRAFARTHIQPSAALSSTIAKAKLHGFMSDKLKVDIDPSSKVQIDVHFVTPSPAPDDG